VLSTIFPPSHQRQLNGNKMVTIGLALGLLLAAPGDDIPPMPEEAEINRAIFAASPLAFTSFGILMAFGHWGPIQIVAAGGIGVAGTLITARKSRSGDPEKMPSVRDAAFSLGVGLGTAACAAVVAHLIPH